MSATLLGVSTTIKVDCGRCGTVELPLAGARLVPLGPHGSTVVDYTCPVCTFSYRQELGERATLLLMHAGVELAVAPEDNVLNRGDSATDGYR